MERYPRMICHKCHACPVTDKDGNMVEFNNIDMYGGFQSTHYTEDGRAIVKSDHYCFIKGVACYADESRFGFIVIQAL